MHPAHHASVTGRSGLRARERVGRLIAGLDLRGVVATLAMRFAGAGLGFFSHVAYARLAGKTQYGLYVGLWSWVVLLGMLAALGLATANTRLAAQYSERGAKAALRGLFSFAMLAPLVSGFVLGAGFIALEMMASPAETMSGQHIAILLAGACVPLFAVGESLRGMARGLGFTALAYAPPFLWRPVLIVLFVIAGLAVFGLVDATVLTSASLLALLLAVGAQARKLRGRLTALNGASRESLVQIRPWLRLSFPLLVMDGYFILASNLDVIVLRHFARPEAVGAYYAASRIAALVNFFPLMIGAQASPQMARLWLRDEKTALAVIARKYAWLAFGGTAVAWFVLFGFGNRILSLFGSDFVMARPVMLLLAGGIVLQTLAGPVRYLLAMSGHERALAVITTGAAIVNLGLNLALIPSHGMMGAALATVISALVFTSALAWFARRRLKIWVGLGTIAGA